MSAEPSSYHLKFQPSTLSQITDIQHATTPQHQLKSQPSSLTQNTFVHNTTTDEETQHKGSPEVWNSTATAPVKDEHIGGIKIDGDSLVVDWADPSDPENPFNWSNGRRWTVTILISAIYLGALFPSSIIAPGVTVLSEELNIHSKTVGALVVSIFVLAFATGPLVLGPLSEVFGRAIVLQCSNVFFLVWNTVCGFAQTPTQLIVFRFLAGLGASAPLSIGGAALSDMWIPERRGKAMAIYNLMPSLSPVVGPLVGSWIAEKSTWRWIFWSSSILQAIIQVGAFFLLQETYAPVILKRKAKRIIALLDQNNAGDEKKSDGLIAIYAGIPFKTVRTVYDTESRGWQNIMYTALTRPFLLFVREPIVQVMGTYLAFVYGMLYLFLTIIPRIFRGVYGQSLGIAGLNYIALGIGIVFASQVNASTSNKIYKHFKDKYHGAGKPEYRLPIIVPASVLLPLGMLITGWAVQKKFFWLFPDIGLAIFGMGMIINFQSIQIYVIDAFGIYSASALAATSFLRCVAGFSFPLFAPSMYDKLGYGVSNTILAVVAIVIGCPAPWILWFYGERLRKGSLYVKQVQPREAKESVL